MNNKDYNEMLGIRRSDLAKIGITPLHFKYAIEHPEEETPALKFGSAAHKFILERDEFRDEYAVAPKVDRRTKEGKEAWSKFVAENEGREVITGDEFQQILEMADAIDSHLEAAHLLAGRHEIPLLWKDDLTEEYCKCKPDCICELNGINYIVDYKTTDSCEDGHFERSCRKYGYYLQAGMYTEGAFQTLGGEYQFAFVAQEKKAPYAVRVYYLSPETIQKGYNEYRKLLGLYHECKVKNEWPGYESEKIMEEDNEND